MMRILFHSLIFLCLASIHVMAYASGKNVYFLTGPGWELFVPRAFPSDQDEWDKPYRVLKEYYVNRGYQFYTTLPKHLDSSFDDDLYVIYTINCPKSNTIGKLSAYALKKTLVIMRETKHILAENYNLEKLGRFGRVLTFDDTLIDNKQIFKDYYVQSSLEMIENLVPFRQKKLCTLIVGNKHSQKTGELYSHREKAIRFFEQQHPQDFDFYGKGWNKNHYPSYRGAVSSKTPTLKNYKFSICYENFASIPGYITEKIFGSFIAGCVPIYWGADEITDYVPSDCFIDKRLFSTLTELYDFIAHISEAEYSAYIKRIQCYLSSPAAKNFSIERFVQSAIYHAKQLQRITH